jgi:hypothetical protein
VRSRNSIPVALWIMVAALAAPGLARAATVEVVVTQSTYYRTHKIVFAGGSGEVNTVSLGVVGELGDHTSGPGTYSVTDSTAPIVAGTGCSGGGPAGSTATCQLPRSVSTSYGIGGPFIMGVTDVFEIDLGDGDDSLDSTGIPAGDGGGGIFYVHGIGGPGADGLVDGPNGASFTPGPGADSVTAGGGSDWAYASEGAADEADLYDLGPDKDMIDYSVAAYPVSVSLAGTADSGAAGEGDRILGAERVWGGSAADLLTGADDLPVSEFNGFGGDDTIVGGAQRDFIEGGSGDDVINGRDGNDSLHGDGPLGADGDDRIRGGDGLDYVVGQNGSDRLSGGSGSDDVFGSTSVTRDHDLDRIDCGPGFDGVAYVGREDRVRRCEGVRLSSARPQPR